MPAARWAWKAFAPTREKGIGRPSTYAPTISTILSRQYVRKEGKYLCPTNLGETVTE
ncbi:MAG: hypothetical protein IJ982_01685, partial [Fibrobacter sp.]|nr:hypothetical protein [Fibrobacter sp.]